MLYEEIDSIPKFVWGNFKGVLNNVTSPEFYKDIWSRIRGGDIDRAMGSGYDDPAFVRDLSRSFAINPMSRAFVKTGPNVCWCNNECS